MKVYPGRAEEMNESIQRMQTYLLLCKAPTNQPHVCTTNVLHNLRQLRRLECSYTP